jgi:diguanylate cyclase (GGDEF)-like protein
MTRLVDLLLTTDPRQRLRLSQSGLASLLMIASVIVMHAAAVLGLSDGRWLWPWTAFSLVGMLVAFTLIRSGWSRRLDDPAMTMAQMVYAIGCAAGGYVIAGRAHGATLLIFAVILMFGMFGLSSAQVRRVSLLTLALLALVMGTMSQHAPALYPVRLEAVYFALTTVVVAGIVVLNHRLWLIRERLHRQRRDLAQALQRIGELATHDDLTGLVNRRRMRESLDEACERSLRTGERWCLALVDADHFKQVNDRHGHGVGDQVLRHLAQTGLAQVRRFDVLARWGGEEFVLLLRDAPLAAALAAVERWRQAQAAQPAAGEVELPCRVTFSAGVAEHRPGETIDQTLARADAALYAAKAKGRDRVEAALPEAPAPPQAVRCP